MDAHKVPLRVPIIPDSVFHLQTVNCITELGSCAERLVKRLNPNEMYFSRLLSIQSYIRTELIKIVHLHIGYAELKNSVF